MDREDAGRKVSTKMVAHCDRDSDYCLHENRRWGRLLQIPIRAVAIIFAVSIGCAGCKSGPQSPEINHPKASGSAATPVVRDPTTASSKPSINGGRAENDDNIRSKRSFKKQQPTSGPNTRTSDKYIFAKIVEHKEFGQVEDERQMAIKVEPNELNPAEFSALSHLKEAFRQEEPVVLEEPSLPDPRIDLANPAPSQPAMQPPVYNVLFSPTVTGTVNHLMDGASTNLTFRIGPRDPGNAIPQSKDAVDKHLEDLASDTQLTITISCDFCEGTGKTSPVQMQRITYYANTHQSSDARFRIVPRRSLAEKQIGAQVIVIEVRDSVTAVRYSSLAVEVVIDSGNNRAGLVSSNDFQASGVFSKSIDEYRSFKPDLIITLLPQTNLPIKLSIEAINTDLKQLLKGSLDVKARGSIQPKSFGTSFLLSRNVSALEDKASAVLEGITERENEALQSELARGINDFTPLKTIDFNDLTHDDRDSILSRLAPLGEYTYAQLFNGPAKRVMEQVEVFQPADHRPLRILIRTQGALFPWQLLKEPASSDDSFWGMKYELAVEPVDRLSPGAVLGKSLTSRHDNSVFGVYGGDDYAVKYYAEEEAGYFAQAMRIDDATTHSAREFLDQLRSRRESLEFILVYTHGSDGYTVRSEGGGAVRVQLFPRGPRLIFSLGEQEAFVQPADLLLLTRGVDLRKTQFFPRGPIVILNACETGVLTSEETTLPETLIELGARGVVATVAKIPNKFAFWFGNHVIEKIAQGEDLSRAMHEITAYYWSQGNPLGLIYSYYTYDGIAPLKPIS